MMLYFSGILCNDMGTPGASEISRRWSMSFERLQAIVMSVWRLDRGTMYFL